MTPMTFTTVSPIVTAATISEDLRPDRLPLAGQTQQPPVHASVTALPAALPAASTVTTFTWRGDGRYSAQPA
jgi:hypothetical protein